MVWTCGEQRSKSKLYILHYFLIAGRLRSQDVNPSSTYRLTLCYFATSGVIVSWNVVLFYKYVLTSSAGVSWIRSSSRPRTHSSTQCDYPYRRRSLCRGCYPRTVHHRHHVRFRAECELHHGIKRRHPADISFTAVFYNILLVLPES